MDYLFLKKINKTPSITIYLSISNKQYLEQMKQRLITQTQT